MTDRLPAEELTTDEGLEEMYFPGPDGRTRGVEELRRRHLTAWFAAGGMFVAIVALWATLLPMQLEGGFTFGMKDSPAWQKFQSSTATQSAEFDRTVSDMRLQLDEIEATQLESARRDAAEAQALRLREKIEAAPSSVAPAVNGLESQPTPTP